MLIISLNPEGYLNWQSQVMYETFKFFIKITGLGNKTDELNINWVNDIPHILCLLEHHLLMAVAPNQQGNTHFVWKGE
jgi:hypothetical protein